MQQSYSMTVVIAVGKGGRRTEDYTHAELHTAALTGLKYLHDLY